MRLKHRSKAALTLVEILSVVAIISILASTVVPAINSFLVGLNITQTGQLLTDEIIAARRPAINLKKPVELRFIQGNASIDGFTALQLWEFDRYGENAKPTGKIQVLPNSIMISEALSPVLRTAINGEADFRPFGKRPYSAIRFRPDGRLQTDLPFEEAYLTLIPRQTSGEVPANFYSIQINPLTGSVHPLRP